MYTCDNLIPNYVSHSLVLFPRCGAETVCVVDRGIKMSVTYKYLPLACSFVYSIRIVMLTPGEDEGALTAEDRGFKTCQLFSRRLEICDGLSDARVVQGQGVVGKFPLLMEGGYRDDSSNLHNQIRRGNVHRGTDFVYQSQTGTLHVPPSEATSKYPCALSPEAAGGREPRVCHICR